MAGARAGRFDGPDLLRWPVLGRFLKWPGSRMVLQAPLLAVGALMVWQGLSGPPLAPRNAATVLTWVHYRGALIVLLLVAGNLFCMACPFMLPRTLARRWAAPVRQWPAALRNKWAAAALFALVLFSYERFALWDSPWLTAWLVIAYFVGALVVDVFFANAPFCKYVCPLGQFNFVASTVSPLELRVADHGICETCRTRDCIEGTPRLAHGRGGHRGCELGLFQPQKRGNLDCTLCLDCVYACPHDNIALTTRVPASELWDDGRRSGVGWWSQRADVTALVIVFTFGSLVNAFAMASPAEAVRAWFEGLSGTTGDTAFLGSLFGTGLVVEPVLLLGAAGWLSRRAGGRPVGLLRTVTTFAYALVPLGFGVWAAHYGLHLLAGLWTFIPVTQDALQSAGVRWLGEPAWELRGLAIGTIRPLQYILILFGLLGSWLVGYRIADREYRTRAWAAFLPWGVLSALLGVWALWIVAQPMQMRGLMMMM